MEIYREESRERISLPTEIVIAILKLLPRNSLIQLRGTVGRTWRDLITPIVFDKLHVRNLTYQESSIPLQISTMTPFCGKMNLGPCPSSAKHGCRRILQLLRPRLAA